jgi:hypothetical protein
MTSTLLTAVERCEKRLPGITADVNGRFLEGMTGEEMLVYLAEKYEVKHIPLSTLYYHRLTRTMAWKQQVQEQKAAYSAMAELVDEKGLDDAGKARLWEAVQTMPPALLIRLREQHIEREKLALDAKDSARRERELELKIQQFSRNVEEATNEAAKQIESGRPLTADDIKRLRERVIGPAPTAAGH